MQTRGAVLEPTLRHALRVWWAFTWRWPLLVVVLAIPFSAFLGLLKKLGYVQFLADWAWVFLQLFTWTTLVGTQLFVFTKLLKMDFPGFRVRVLESEDEG